MADPKQKSIELPSYLRRAVPLWQTPAWLEADRWRRVVRSQPIAIICRDTLIAYLQALPWEITARDPKEQDALAEDIEYYTEVLNGHGVDFDTKIDKLWQDALDLPIGGNLEIVRWPPGGGPLSRPNPKGHVWKLANVDGATLFPTGDAAFPMGQRVKSDFQRPIYFATDEMGRVLITSRPEIERQGYGMAPPEKVYLALSLLYRGDTYYANLLLDTPEAGLLDLRDMSKETATEWLKSFRELLTGIDPMKIPVLYEHDEAAVFIPFGKPPTEMMFDSVTLKYARMLTAGYWLSLSDIGLAPGSGKSLAGQIRDERRSRRTGFGVVKEKTRNLFNNKVLPRYLEFNWLEQDEEALVQRYRAFNLATNAMKAAKEAGIMSALERQQQLVKDGLITIEVVAPEERPPPLPFGGSPFNPVQNELDRVPPSQGGEGDITARAELGERVAAAPPGSATFDQMAMALRQAFGEVTVQMGDAQLKKLIRAATRSLFPATEQALVELSDAEVAPWLEQRFLLWYEEPSAFDDLPDVKKASQEVLDALDEILDTDTWWQIPDKTASALDLIMNLAFSEGATDAAQTLQELLYVEGMADSPDLIGFNFNLTNPRTLAELERKAAQLVTRVNDGTRFYIKRVITSGVEEGLSSPAIAQMIRDGAGVDEVLREGGFTEAVIKEVRNELGTLNEYRTVSITNTEIAKAETDGRVAQWQETGLTRKRWVHTGATGPDDPCPFCKANIEMDFVPMDFMYESVFGPATTLGPPAHPSVDHCHIEFDENEMIDKAGELTPWLGD